MSEPTPVKRQRLSKLILLVAGLASFGASVAALATYLRDEKPIRELGIHVDSIISLTPASSEGTAKDVIITYRGEALREPYQLRITFSNDGNQPINPSEVEKTVTLQSMSSRVITTSVSSQSPADLSATCERSEADKIAFPHKLINPGDRIVCDAILDGAPSQFLVGGRIAGISAPRLHLPVPGDDAKYFLSLPNPFMLALLILSSAASVIGILVASLLTWEAWDMWGSSEWIEATEDHIRKMMTLENLQQKIQEAMIANNNAILASAAPYFRLEWLTSPENILTDLERHRASPLEQPSVLIRNCEFSAETIRKHLPELLDQAQWSLLTMTFQGGSVQCRYASQLAKKYKSERQSDETFELVLQPLLKAAIHARIKPNALRRALIAFWFEDWLAIFALFAVIANVILLIEAWNYYMR